MLTGLQDMKDHKTEFKNLSKTAGHVILQNTRPLCVTTGDAMCIFPETQLLLLQVGPFLFIFLNQSKDTAHHHDDTASPNSPDIGLQMFLSRRKLSLFK